MTNYFCEWASKVISCFCFGTGKVTWVRNPENSNPNFYSGQRMFPKSPILRKCLLTRRYYYNWRRPLSTDKQAAPEYDVIVVGGGKFLLNIINISNPFNSLNQVTQASKQLPQQPECPPERYS